MIATWLAEQAALNPDAVLLSSEGERWTWAACREEIERLVAALTPLRGTSVGVVGASEPATLLRVCALNRLGCHVYMLPPDLGSDVVNRIAAELGFQLLTPPLSQPAGLLRRQPIAPDDIVLFTSGSTGTPKPVRHTWSSLAERIRVSASLTRSRWLLTYALSSFAGTQVMLHALLNGGQLSLGSGRPETLAELAVRDGVTHVSGTPTFFRFLLATAAPDLLSRCALRQVTLGGEAVDQACLDGLRHQFPGAQITHVYASTEAGVCFSVHDGLAGFPAHFLQTGAFSGAVQLQIRDGELYVCSRRPRTAGTASETAQDGFVATGDLVHCHGDRVHFLGRRHERINIGGNKVFPAEVEQVLQQIECVEAVRVFPKPSPLVGQVVCAEILLRPGYETAAARAAIQAYCRERLPAFKRPRLIDFVAEIPVTGTGKLVRRRLDASGPRPLSSPRATSSRRPTSRSAPNP